MAVPDNAIALQRFGYANDKLDTWNVSYASILHMFHGTLTDQLQLKTDSTLVSSSDRRYYMTYCLIQSDKTSHEPTNGNGPFRVGVNYTISRQQAKEQEQLIYLPDIHTYPYNKGQNLLLIRTNFSILGCHFPMPVFIPAYNQALHMVTALDQRLNSIFI